MRILVIIHQTKGLFVPYPDQGDVGINRPIDIIFDDFQYIKNSHCEISLHHQLLKNSSQGRFYHPYVSFKNTDPIALSFILSAEYSVKKALDKPLFGYQHLLWCDSLALEALPCFGASFFVM